MKTPRLLTIFLIVFVDLLGFSLILPLLPYYAEAYGASPAIVGLLVASYAAAQLIGAPLLGRLSDRLGRRPVLMFSVAGTFLGFILLGLADPLGRMLAGLVSFQSANIFIIAILFFSRILDGLTGGNLNVAQAYIADITNESNRAKSLGLIGAAFGLGFILGPAAGGLLSQWGYNIPAFVAALISAFNLLAIIFLLPESLSPENRENLVTRQRPPFTLKALLAVLNRPIVGPLLYVRLFYGLAFAIFESIFSLYAQSIGLSSQTTGFVLAYVGLLSVITQAGLIGPLTRRFRESWLIISGLWIMGISLLAWAFTSQLWLLLVVILPLSLSGGVLNTVMQSSISKSVSHDEIGGILGITASLDAFTRVVAPSLGGFLLGYFGRWAPGIFTAILMALAISFTYRRIVIPARRIRMETGAEGSHA